MSELEPIDTLLSSLGTAALLDEVQVAGAKVNRSRCQCPWKNCAGKGPGRSFSASVHVEKGHPRVNCFACGTKGDLIDLLEVTRGLDRAGAIAHLRGVTPARPRPVLAVVPSPRVDDSEKIPPAEVRRIWEALATEHEAAEAYLESRGLGEAASAGLVRFAKADGPKAVAGHAKRGYAVVALLRDVHGDPRGAQLRLVGRGTADQSKVVSLKGSSPSMAFFGTPELIESSPIVAVTEGLADTLAVQLWAAAHPDVAVVGAAGKAFLRHLATELERAAVPVEGKVFALFVQNDAPKNVSRREFDTLARALVARGAEVAWVETPKEIKDVADWRQAQPLEVWPPAGLARALEPTDDTPLSDRRVVLDGVGVPMPGQYTVDSLGQDLRTLAALLEGPHREALLGKDGLSWCLMTERVKLGDEPLKDSTVQGIRRALEEFRTSAGNKPLKFSTEDVMSTLVLLAHRRQVHPVRDWLRSLKWDGARREAGLASALWHQDDGMATQLLRRWLISAVARAMTPGCKVDTVLVLIGQQGAGKSRFFAEMGGPWHTDSPVSVADKDGKLVMRQAWIVEWAELDSMRKARDQEAVKAFLSARIDVFRKPYARDVIEAPRHSVIVGTTNNREFLFDVTGNRRFWPIELSGPVDLEWVRENREQLWAQAVVEFEAGERYHLSPEEDAILAETNREHESQDVWFDPISDWIDDHPDMHELTVGQALHLGLNRKVDSWTRGDEMRVAQVLRQLGWSPRNLRKDGTRRRLYVRHEVKP